MSEEPDAVSRRSVLKATAGAVPVAGAGLASAGTGADGVDRYNVGYSAGSGLAATRVAASEVVREYSFDALTVRLPARAVDGLRERPDVRYVEADGTMTVHGQTLPWGVDRIDADRAPEKVDGAGIDVAVLDTGIDSDHPDLEANLGDGAWVEGLECTSCDVGWGDNYDDGVNVGHGTQVAGIIGAVDNSIDVVGVAPAVTLHSVKVCDSDGGCADSDIAAGLEWVADQNYHVANMSFGKDYASVVADAVDYAADRNVVMVASAGNDGPCTDCVSYPAWDVDTIAVTAMTDEEALRTDSSQGDMVDLTAPGEDIPTTAPDGGTALFQRTSAAAPHVSGTAALARVLVPDRQDAMDLLLDKAEDIGLTADEQGEGLVDAGAVANEPWVVTAGASTVLDSEATLNGDLKLTGFASSVDVHFEWGPRDQGTGNDTATQTLTSAGSFSDTISGLDCGTDYQFRAVAEASDGDGGVSDLEYFSTAPCDDGGDCGDQIIC